MGNPINYYSPSATTIHNDLLYFFWDTYKGTGHWHTLDLRTAQYASNGANAYPTGRFPAPMHNGSYFITSHELQADSSTKGFVVNDRGQVSKTLLVPYYSFIASASFADSANGLVSAHSFTADAWLHQTTDGGQSWQSDDSDLLNLPMKIQGTAFMSRDAQCLFFRNQDSILRTDRSYGNPQVGTLSLNSFMDAHFSSCDTGVVMDDGNLYLTVDGGQSFSNVLSYNGFSYFGEVNDGYVLGSWNNIYKSQKLSGPWSLLKPMNRPTHYTYYWITEDLKVFGHDEMSQLLYYSSDTGDTYQNAFLPSSRIHSIYQTNDTTYLMFGSGGSTHRLVIVDSLIIHDTVAATSGVGIEEQASAVYFFPNPATAQVNLKFPDSRKRSLQLWSTDGKLMLERKVRSESYRLDIRELEGAMYFLKVIADGNMQTFRILKME